MQHFMTKTTRGPIVFHFFVAVYHRFNGRPIWRVDLHQPEIVKETTPIMEFVFLVHNLILFVISQIRGQRVGLFMPENKTCIFFLGNTI